MSVEPERCDCGLPATMAGMCSECYICTPCNHDAEIDRLRGMVWWLATEIVADQPEDEREEAKTYVGLAEKFWELGLRFEQRPIDVGQQHGRQT